MLKSTNYFVMWEIENMNFARIFAWVSINTSLLICFASLTTKACNLSYFWVGKLICVCTICNRKNLHKTNHMKLIKPFIYAILILAILGGGYYSWQFYTKAKTPVLDALFILPNDAAVVVGFNDYKKFKSQLGVENVIWKDIRNTYQLECKKGAVDSILNGLSEIPEIESVLNNPLTKMYISYHFAGRNRFETVYSFSVPNIIDDRVLLNLLESDHQVKVREFKDEKIYEISLKSSKKVFYLSQLRGVICLTSYAPLAEKIVLSALAANPERQKLKYRMLKMSGKDIAANVYVNYRYLYRLLSQYSATKYRPLLMSLGQISQVANFDLKIQNDRISLSGFSIQNDSFPSFLSTYHSYEPEIIRATNILPASTSFMFYQGADKLSDLLNVRSEGDFSERDEELLQRYKARYLVDVGDYFYPWIRNEVVFAFTKTQSSDLKDGAYAVVETTDIKEAEQMLLKLAKTVADKKDISQDTTKHLYRSYELHSIALSNIVPALFGKMFSSIENTFYTYIDNYVVFANSELALQNIIDNYLIERVLSNSEAYINTLHDVSDEASVFMYVNLHYMRSNINKFLSKEGLEFIEHSGLSFDNFGTFAVQYISSDQGVYTSIVLNHSGLKEIDEPIAWKTALDNPIARGPFHIKNHRNNKQEILVFDKAKLMYRIDQNGSIAWAVPVLEYPMSDVYMVDFYKNGKYQYMFSSKNYLYLYDLNGNRVEDYPVKLPIEAVAPMTLVDYDRNKNYRILIPLADGKVYNFKIDGTQTQGWKYPAMKEPIRQKVQVFKLGSKDFLVISDTAGNAVYANRRGESRMDAQLAFTNNPKTIFYKKDGSGKPKIITTDMMGRVVSLDAVGNVEKLLLHEFSPNHSFAYFDFNGDKRKDYIFLDQNNVYVFNHRNKLIFQHSFKQQLSPIIIGVKMSTQDSIRMILHDAENQKVILVTKSGRVIEKNDYHSQKNFIKEEATKSEIIRLIGVHGRIVNSFLIN